MAVGGGGRQSNVACFTLDDEVALGEEDLAMAVVITAPHFLAGGGFEADEVRDVIAVAVV